jgi:hypothetical protein
MNILVGKVFSQYMNAVMVFVPRNDWITYRKRAKSSTLIGKSGDVAYSRAGITSNSKYIKIDITELQYRYPHNTIRFLSPSKHNPLFDVY